METKQDEADWLTEIGIGRESNNKNNANKAVHNNCCYSLYICVSLNKTVIQII